MEPSSTDRMPLEEPVEFPPDGGHITSAKPKAKLAPCDPCPQRLPGAFVTLSDLHSDMFHRRWIRASTLL